MKGKLENINDNKEKGGLKIPLEAALSAAAASLRPCKFTLKEGCREGLGYSAVAEHVPSVCEAPGPIFSTTKEKKVKKYVGRRAELTVD